MAADNPAVSIRLSSAHDVFYNGHRCLRHDDVGNELQT